MYKIRRKWQNKLTRYRASGKGEYNYSPRRIHVFRAKGAQKSISPLATDTEVS